MKQLILVYTIVGALWTGLFKNTEVETGYVRVRPATPFDFKPATPGTNYTWIEGSWVWNKTNYFWKPGFWTVPPENKEWIAGRWMYTTEGYRWVKGHWRVIQTD